MKRFKNILVIPDALAEDDPALARAFRLAHNNQARLTISWIIEEQDVTEASIGLQTEMVDIVRAELDKLARPAREEGLRVDTHVLVGRPFIEIIRRVTEHDHDLVMKTARGRRLYSNLFFGTTALHLMRKAACPVWIVHPQPDKATGGVLAAINSDTTDEERMALNVKLMELATSLSVLEECDLHVAHAWSVPYEDMVRHSPFLRITKNEAENYVGDIEARHRQRFDALTSRFQPSHPKMQLHFVKGAAQDAIPKMATDLNVEIIVMATLARTGIPGLFIGNTAEAILSQVKCSVLAIKPEAFISPVAA